MGVAGFGDPNPQGGCTAPLPEWRFFLCPVHGIALLGRWCVGGLVPAGFLEAGSPTRTFTALFVFCSGGNLKKRSWSDGWIS